MATAVGVNILSRIAPVLAKGIEQRYQSGPDESLKVLPIKLRLKEAAERAWSSCCFIYFVRASA